MHAFSAIPDIDADRDAEMRTVATTLGQNGTLAFCAVCYTSASLLAAHALGSVSLILGGIYLLMLALSRRDVFGIYRRFPVVNAAAGMAIFFTVLLRLP